MKVSEVSLPKGQFPLLSPSSLLKEALEEMERHHIGMAVICDSEGGLKGVFTDGDLRRLLLNVQKPLASFFIDDVLDHSIKNPIAVASSGDLESALEIMEKQKIWDLPVINKEGEVCGLLHLHPALKAVLFNQKGGK